MTKTITLKIWNQQECKVIKTFEIANVLNVTFETIYSSEIDFNGDDIEILIFPGLNDIEFDFSGNKKYVFITIKDYEEQ